jgi:hypothetical protein
MEKATVHSPCYRYLMQKGEFSRTRLFLNNPITIVVMFLNIVNFNECSLPFNRRLGYSKFKEKLVFLKIKYMKVIL